jgi:hypothetical protein
MFGIEECKFCCTTNEKSLGAYLVYSGNVEIGRGGGGGKNGNCPVYRQEEKYTILRCREEEGVEKNFSIKSV